MLKTIFGLGKTKISNDLRNAEQKLIAGLAKMDFDTVSEFQLEAYSKALDDLTQQMAKAKSVYEKEQQEADAIRASYDDKVAVAEKLDFAIKSPTTTLEMKTKMEASLDKLLTDVESMGADIENEAQEATDAKEHYNALVEAVKVASERLAGARKALTDKKRQLDHIAVEEKRAAERARQQETLAGLRSDVDSFGTVIGALDTEIEERRQKVTALNAKADALKVAQKRNSNELDLEVLFAIGEVKKEDKPSLNERMAKLRK